MNRLLVFNHWPKCGGTSVRKSIVQVFGQEELLFCYGKEHLLATLTPKHKTDFISTYMTLYRGEHHRKIDEQVADGRIQVVFGHVAPLPRSIKSRETIYVTMMRNPLTRFVSHYNHYARYLERSHPEESPVSFEDFIQRDIFGVEDVDAIDRYDHIFFYEQYSEGLAKFSELLGRPLQENRVNVSKAFLKRSEETDDIVRKYRRGRIQMYEFARRKHLTDEAR